MIYRKFARTGFSVSAVGMGTYYDFRWIAAAALLGKQFSRARIMSAIRTGIDAGINLIDTAEFYRSEELVGEAIRGYDREKLFIATKVFPTHLRREKVIRACEKSLKRLGVDYIDLYQIHFPNPRVPIAETMAAMEELADRGMIRHIGVSNFSLPRMKEAVSSLRKYPLSSNQMHYNLIHRDVERDILPYCEEMGIALLAYYPVAHGKLADAHGGRTNVIASIKSRYGFTTNAQIALTYLISRSKNTFPIPRASNPVHVSENAALGGKLLSPEDIEALVSASG